MVDLHLWGDSWDINHRIEQYGYALDDIEAAENEGIGIFIEFDIQEVKGLFDLLNSDIYKTVSNKRNYLILRLHSFVSYMTSSMAQKY